MDHEDIERHIGKTYQVDLEDIKIKITIEALEIDEDDLPLSLRTEKRRTAGGLDTASLNYSRLQYSQSSAKTDDVLHSRSQVQKMPKMQAKVKTGMFDKQSMKLGSVDEVDQESISILNSEGDIGAVSEVKDPKTKINFL
jgi:hypothetical protein